MAAGEVTPADLAVAEMLSGLPDDALEHLASEARVSTFRSGEVIFDKGAPGSSLHIVRDGRVKIARDTNPDTEPLAWMLPGDVFGELAVFDPAPRSAAAIADDGAATIEIDRDDLERVIEQNPHAAIRMTGAIARSLTMAKEQLKNYSQFLDKRVRERTLEVRETQLEVIRRLGVAAEYRDEDTGAHIFRMSNYSAELAKKTGEFDEASLEMLINAAPMHDVGKIGIPDRVLLKPGKLTDDEWELMRAHTIMGANMLAGSRSPVIQLAKEIALTHHEKWDGSGYPNGLKGENIPLEARVCCIADVFDALTSVRPYKKAWTVDAALEEIESLGGKAFDPELTRMFVDMREEIEQIRTNPKGMETLQAVEDVADDRAAATAAAASE